MADTTGRQRRPFRAGAADGVPLRPVLLIPEPAGDVEPEPLRRGDVSQVGFQGAQPLRPDDPGPAGPQLVEYPRRPVQRVEGAAGEPYNLAPGVGRVGRALQVAQPLQVVDRLARRLLGDATA